MVGGVLAVATAISLAVIRGPQRPTDCSLWKRGCSETIQMVKTGNIQTTVNSDYASDQMVGNTTRSITDLSITGRGHGEHPLVVIERYEDDFNDLEIHVPLTMEISQNEEPTGKIRIMW